MKKILAVILALLYISSATGSTVHLHYCMGKLANWSLDKEISQTCGQCGMEKTNTDDNGCCKDEHTFLKTQADQKTTESAYQLLGNIALTLPPSSIQAPAKPVATAPVIKSTSNNILRCSSIPIYLFHSIFLI